MKSPSHPFRMLLTAGAVGALLAGCSPHVTAPNAAPNVTPAGDRNAMIRWHQEHDSRPGAPPPGR